MPILFIHFLNNNNTDICNAHSVSKHTESEMQAVARWGGWREWSVKCYLNRLTDRRVNLQAVCLQPFGSNIISWVQSLHPPSSLDCGQLLTKCVIVWQFSTTAHVGCSKVPLVLTIQYNIKTCSAPYVTRMLIVDKMRSGLGWSLVMGHDCHCVGCLMLTCMDDIGGQPVQLIAWDDRSPS